MEFAEVITKPRLDGISFWRNDGTPSLGSLVITGHHLLLESEDKLQTSFVILHKCIDIVQIELKPLPSIGAIISLKCKNFSVLYIDCSSSVDDCSQISKSLEILSNLASVKLHYPFFYRLNFRIYEDGWSSFNFNENELIRLQSQSDFWRVSDANKSFAICSTYPEQVIVPKSISDDILKCSASFREGGRFPVLCYYHKDTKAVIVRCSQPFVGNSNRRCKEDEMLLNALLNSSDKGYIIDTRSQASAQAARLKGYGYEPEMHYPRWRRIHRTTPKWSQLQESLVKLVDACNDNDISPEKWISKLSSSGWLQNVAELLDCACIAAQCADREGENPGQLLHNSRVQIHHVQMRCDEHEDTIYMDTDGSSIFSEMSVIVHGNEGTDSTLIVVSLIQIILDPDCRTIRGFEALIEREWVKGGHPFASRCAHLAYGKSKAIVAVQDAPTFLLFLDCVWQIYNQFSCSFEFTDALLVFIFDNAYASEFGTFLCNNEKEKVENDVKRRTVSLWSYLNRPDVLCKYLNPFYEPNKEAVWPSIAPQSIELWQFMYFRWTSNWANSEKAWHYLIRMKEEERQLYSEIIQSQRILMSLQ